MISLVSITSLLVMIMFHDFTRRIDHRSNMIRILQEDLYGLAYGAGWEPCDLHNLAHACGVGSVLIIYRFCTTSHYGRYKIYMISMICMIYSSRWWFVRDVHDFPISMISPLP